MVGIPTHLSQKPGAGGNLTDLDWFSGQGFPAAGADETHGQSGYSRPFDERPASDTVFFFPSHFNDLLIHYSFQGLASFQAKSTGHLPSLGKIRFPLMEESFPNVLGNDPPPGAFPTFSLWLIADNI
jgi:hypothetical protein